MASPAYRPSPGAPAASREPVSRSAEATGAGLALGLIVLGLVLRAVLTDTDSALQGAAAGLLASGLALEVYARALGVWVTRENTGLAVALGVIGSPAVLWHALTRRRGRIAPEPGAVGALLVPVALVVFFWAQISAS